MVGEIVQKKRDKDKKCSVNQASYANSVTLKKLLALIRFIDQSGNKS